MLAAATVFAGEPLAGIRLEGALPFPHAKAIELAALPEGTPLDDAAADAAAGRIRDACRRRHYPQARVEWQREPLHDGRQNLLLRSTLGRKGRLKQVRFSGCRAIGAADLRRGLRVRPKPAPWSRWLGTDAVMDADLAGDRSALYACYHRQGHAAAEIGDPVLEWVEGLDGFRLTWPILHEGPVYQVGYIRLDAPDLPSDDVLRRIIGVNAGERFERRRVQEAVRRFEAYYQGRGHAFPSVEAIEEWDDAQARIDLLFRATPGTQPVLRRILVSGNTNTAERIILREIPLKPGQRFDGEAVQETLARLSALPMFSKVEVSCQGASDQPFFDLGVDVAERRTGRAEVGVVYGESEGAAFQVNVTEKNLSLLPPFRGEALQAGLGMTLGEKVVRGDATFCNPRLFDSRWSLDVQGSYEDSEAISDYYDQRSHGASLLVSHPLGRHHMLSTGYAVTGHEVYNLEEAAEPLLQPSFLANQDLLLTSWIAAWSMDYTDRMIRPTRGARLRGTVGLGSRALGGDTDVVQTEVAGTLFISPFFHHVLSLRGGVKSVDPYGGTDEVALPLRNFLGGSRDLRGFEYRSVSPLDELGRPMGGQSAWWATAEYRIPLLRWLDLAVYYDVGDVSLESYAYSGEGPVGNWGVGLLVQAEEFPVRFDFATPIRTLEGDRQNEEGKPHFSFSAGFRF
ncbi:MAG: BamA/OMP85 family outer membrane protein [Kiritimatiellia bacterium]